jgi:hypothetical protein
MARWREPSWPASPPAALVRFLPADWPAGDPVAAWKSARRQWCRLHGYVQPGPPYPDSSPAGPLGDVIDMLVAEREARMSLVGNRWCEQAQ